MSKWHYSEEQQAFYHSTDWKKCRKAYKSFAGGLCERCWAKGIVRPGKIVHHKEYITKDNIDDIKILLSFDNLELLCMDCHNKEHIVGEKRYKRKLKRKRRYEVQEDGSVVIPPIC